MLSLSTELFLNSPSLKELRFFRFIFELTKQNKLEYFLYQTSKTYNIVFWHAE
jgi:hypothetical protein